jgi:hypothetical protein
VEAASTRRSVSRRAGAPQEFAEGVQLGSHRFRRRSRAKACALARR